MKSIKMCCIAMFLALPMLSLGASESATSPGTYACCTGADCKNLQPQGYFCCSSNPIVPGKSLPKGPGKSLPKWGAKYFSPDKKTPYKCDQSSCTMETKIYCGTTTESTDKPKTDECPTLSKFATQMTINFNIQSTRCTAPSSLPKD